MHFVNSSRSEAGHRLGSDVYLKRLYHPQETLFCYYIIDVKFYLMFFSWIRTFLTDLTRVQITTYISDSPNNFVQQRVILRYAFRFLSQLNIIKRSASKARTNPQLAHRLARITLQYWVTNRYLSALRCENKLFRNSTSDVKPEPSGLCTQIVVNGFRWVWRKNNRSPSIESPHIRLRNKKVVIQTAIYYSLENNQMNV